MQEPSKSLARYRKRRQVQGEEGICVPLPIDDSSIDIQLTTLETSNDPSASTLTFLVFSMCPSVFYYP